MSPINVILICLVIICQNHKTDGQRWVLIHYNTILPAADILSYDSGWISCYYTMVWDIFRNNGIYPYHYFVPNMDSRQYYRTRPNKTFVTDIRVCFQISTRIVGKQNYPPPVTRVYFPI